LKQISKVVASHFFQTVLGQVFFLQCLEIALNTEHVSHVPKMLDKVGPYIVVATELKL